MEGSQITHKPSLALKEGGARQGLISKQPANRGESRKKNDERATTDQSEDVDGGGFKKNSFVGKQIDDNILLEYRSFIAHATLPPFTPRRKLRLYNVTSFEIWGQPPVDTDEGVLKLNPPDRAFRTDHRDKPNMTLS